jgi:uncharacterized repeat protein (TIGR03803 family)
VFKVTTNGTLTTLASFNGTNGAYPLAAMTLGIDGNFYGTTPEGGFTNSTFPSGMGTVFQVTTNGTLTTLYSFTGRADGEGPQATLTLGNDGNFYGTTGGGGLTNSTYPSGMGTVFRLLLPLITVQPQSQTNMAGATVTFLVSATDPNPMSFQWQKNGTNLVHGGNISGATTNTLTITSISDGDAANYSVIVSNTSRSVTSSNATLTVIDPPMLGLQLSAGCPLLSLYGMLSNKFVVQYTTNPAGTNWFSLLSLTNLKAYPYLFRDSGGAGQPARFYRAWMW